MSFLNDAAGGALAGGCTIGATGAIGASLGGGGGAGGGTGALKSGGGGASAGCARAPRSAASSVIENRTKAILATRFLMRPPNKVDVKVAPDVVRGGFRLTLRLRDRRDRKHGETFGYPNPDRPGQPD